MKLFGKWILLVGVFFFVSAQAASEKYQCKLSKRLDESSLTWSEELKKDVSISTFESVNDFVFEEYPWLLIESVTGGWEVRVGAMSYGDGQFSTEPETISKTLDGEVTLFSYDNPEGDNKWQVRLDPRTRIAKFIAENDDGNPIDTAEFTCE